jgi:[acyl-carrier-protein] S-malonyltransferase
MKTAFLFPGQGAQTIGMGLDLYDNFNIYRQTFDICSESAGLDLKGACFEGSRMDESEVVQTAIFAHSISLLNVLKSEGFDADIYAGLSLGEYTALTASGVFGIAQCAALVRKRGSIMDSAFPKGEGGMLSVIGFTAQQVEAELSGFEGAVIANHLSELQTAVSGRIKDLNALKERFDGMGAKMTSMLSVSGPFHSPFLRGAADKFYGLLEAENIGTISKTVYSNVLGYPYEKDNSIRKLLAEQMCSRVRWYDCVENMVASGVDRYVEAGPSNVLSKLVKRRAEKGVAVESIRDLPTLEKFLSENKQ